MKQFVQTLIDKLGTASYTIQIDGAIVASPKTVVDLSVAKDIICQLSESADTENHNSWIPCSKKLPEDCTIYEVTAQFGNGMCYTEFAYYDESKGEWWKHDDDGTVNVLAWKAHSVPYQMEGDAHE